MRLLLVIFLSALVGCSALSEPEPLEEEKNDYYALFSHLLSINEDRYLYTDAEGISHIDELKLFKELEQIYTSVMQPSQRGDLSKEQARVILFFAFYAESKNSAAFNEYLAADLMPVFLMNRSVFIEAMAALPFLIPAACNRLNAFFGFEDKHFSGKQAFINENKILFENAFTDDQLRVCFAEFED